MTHTSGEVQHLCSFWLSTKGRREDGMNGLPVVCGKTKGLLCSENLIGTLSQNGYGIFKVAMDLKSLDVVIKNRRKCRRRCLEAALSCKLSCSPSKQQPSRKAQGQPEAGLEAGLEASRQASPRTYLVKPTWLSQPGETCLVKSTLLKPTWLNRPGETYLVESTWLNHLVKPTWLNPAG